MPQICDRRDAESRGTILAEHQTMLTILLIVLLVLAIGGGGWGHSKYGAAGWSPAAIILVICAVLFFTGNLHL